jgi:putative nucleotidyltransferase with HDIG domain
MSESVDQLLERSGALRGLRESLGSATDGVWVVGGAVRDLLLGRDPLDLDLAVAGDAKAVARRVHDAYGGDIFSLSDRFGTWRVQPADRNWHADITTLRGESIEQDLSMRDFTVNAMALAAGGNKIIDPHGGVADVEGRVLRVLGAGAYTDDALRPLRLPRLAAKLGFEPDAATAALTREHASGVNEAAPERIFAELRELVRADGVLRGLELLYELGVMEVIWPELSELRGVEQSVYHHLDAYGHTIEVLTQLLEIERAPEQVFAEDAEALTAELANPLSDELTRGEALRWAALLHDIAKSRTRTVYPGGRVGFPQHDELGSKLARAICRRLHTSERLSQYIAAITREHLRLGFLVHAAPLTRLETYRYLRACEPVEVEVNVLSAADRMATRGRKADDSIAAHLDLVKDLTHAALERRAAGAAEPLIRGDSLAAALEISPGPQLGRLLDAIEEARYCGEVTTEQDAVELARSLL